MKSAVVKPYMVYRTGDIVFAHSKQELSKLNPDIHFSDVYDYSMYNQLDTYQVRYALLEYGFLPWQIDYIINVLLSHAVVRRQQIEWEDL